MSCSFFKFIFACTLKLEIDHNKILCVLNFVVIFLVSTSASLSYISFQSQIVFLFTFAITSNFNECKKEKGWDQGLLVPRAIRPIGFLDVSLQMFLSSSLLVTCVKSLMHLKISFILEWKVPHWVYRPISKELLVSSFRKCLEIACKHYGHHHWIHPPCNYN